MALQPHIQTLGRSASSICMTASPFRYPNMLPNSLSFRMYHHDSLSNTFCNHSLGRLWLSHTISLLHTHATVFACVTLILASHLTERKIHRCEYSKYYAFHTNIHPIAKMCVLNGPLNRLTVHLVGSMCVWIDIFAGIQTDSSVYFGSILMYWMYYALSWVYLSLSLLVSFYVFAGESSFHFLIASNQKKNSTFQSRATLYT